MKDIKARFMALSAVVGLCGTVAMGTAYADATTEPDAAALAVQVQELRQQVDDVKSFVFILSGDADRNSSDDSWTRDRLATLEQFTDCIRISKNYRVRDRFGYKRFKKFPVLAMDRQDEDCKAIYNNPTP